MNFKIKLKEIEKRLNPRKRQGFVVFTGYSDEEFEKQRAEYLRKNPEPDLFVCLRKFSDADFQDDFIQKGKGK